MLKHHTKDKAIKKKAKEDKLVKEFEAHKKVENNQLFQTKLKQMQAEKEQRSKSVTMKMKRIDTKKEELKHAVEEYKSDKHEFNN